MGTANAYIRHKCGHESTLTPQSTNSGLPHRVKATYCKDCSERLLTALTIVAEITNQWKYTAWVWPRPVIINPHGKEIDHAYAVQMMDNDIRDMLERELSERDNLDVTEAAFIREYAIEHKIKFGETWELATANPTL